MISRLVALAMMSASSSFMMWACVATIGWAIQAIPAELADVYKVVAFCAGAGA